MEFLSEYYDNSESIRKAVVKDDNGFLVELWEHGKLVETRDLRHKSLQYAEDCAENWVEGIIK
jgi:hypothetical protein